MTYLVVDLNSKAETIALKLIFVIQRLDDLQGASSVIVSDHSELICTVTAIFYHLKFESEVNVVTEYYGEDE